MINTKFIISYDGSRYYGWEHQPNTDLTIQGKIETVLERMTGKPVELISAGRTDAGVHAKAMVANAVLDTDLTEEKIMAYMNRYLPDDIGIEDVKFCAERFHSRYKAVGKTYCYTCYFGKTKPVFDRKYVYVLEKMPDLDAMRAAAEILKGEHDFFSFCTNGKSKKSTVRIVDKIDIKQKGSYITFTYHGTGFLQHMVRILTGTLLEVGWHQRSVDSIKELLEKPDRKSAGATAPAQGLCLIEVDYS